MTDRNARKLQPNRCGQNNAWKDQAVVTAVGLEFDPGCHRSLENQPPRVTKNQPPNNVESKEHFFSNKLHISR